MERGRERERRRKTEESAAVHVKETSVVVANKSDRNLDVQINAV